MGSRWRGVSCRRTTSSSSRRSSSFARAPSVRPRAAAWPSIWSRDVTRSPTSRRRRATARYSTPPPPPSPLSTLPPPLPEGALPRALRGAPQPLRRLPQEGAHAAHQRAARRRAAGAQLLELPLPYISPVSPLHFHCISPVSPLGAQLLELLPGQPARAPLPLRVHRVPPPARQLHDLPDHPPHARRLRQVALPPLTSSHTTTKALHVLPLTTTSPGPRPGRGTREANPAPEKQKVARLESMCLSLWNSLSGLCHTVCL